MGFIKPVITAEDHEYEYWKLGSYLSDDDVSPAEFVAIFKLFKDRDTAVAGGRSAQQIAKMVVRGEAFDAYFARAVIDALDHSLIEHIYLVAAIISANPTDDAYIKCDFDSLPVGSSVFADAEIDLN